MAVISRVATAVLHKRAGLVTTTLTSPYCVAPNQLSFYSTWLASGTLTFTAPVMFLVSLLFFSAPCSSILQSEPQTHLNAVPDDQGYMWEVSMGFIYSHHQSPVAILD